MTPIAGTIAATVFMGLTILATRAFPFLLFSRRDPPRIIRFAEKYIPPTVMAVLVVYCLKDIRWTESPSGFREILAIALVILLHALKKNALLSIFGGTAFYMILINIWK